MSLAQLVSSSGENVAGLIHGFESRWGHHRNYTQLHRNGIRPLPSTLDLLGIGTLKEQLNCLS